jgi:hypothetical protein
MCQMLIFRIDTRPTSFGCEVPVLRANVLKLLCRRIDNLHVASEILVTVDL